LKVQEAVSEKQIRKSISLNSFQSPYKNEARFLVIPANLEADFQTCAGIVRSHSGTGAWLQPEKKEVPFPAVSELLLIKFCQEFVYTHQVRVLAKEKGAILVSLPSETQREKSLLAPSTGRYDYRIDVSIPVRVKTDWLESKDASPKLARLTNLSRGGMALLTPANQKYTVGMEITVRVVGWDHPVRIEAIVNRVVPAESKDKNRIALEFPDYIDVTQREMISSFILQVQRRQALGRALPTLDSDSDKS
jgi:c-di-GMP-binding flagellar brake protein YcgR